MAKVLILGGGFAGVVAAGRLAKSLGREHELTLGVDEGGSDSAFLHMKLWEEGGARTGRGHFRGWAKRAQEKYFQALHS